MSTSAVSGVSGSGPPAGPAGGSVSGIVLVGGRSQRMGRDKATLEVGGRTLVQRAVDALVAAGAIEVVLVGAPHGVLPEVTSTVAVLEARDSTAHDGPLQGIVAGLEQVRGAVAVVVGCDMPFLRPALLALLARRAAEAGRPVLPLHGRQPEGLCSAWPRSSLDALRARLEAGERAVASTAERLGAVLLEPAEYAAADPEGVSFTNVNTPEEFAAIQSTTSGGGTGV